MNDCCSISSNLILFIWQVRVHPVPLTYLIITTKRITQVKLFRGKRKKKLKLADVRGE